VVAVNQSFMGWMKISNGEFTLGELWYLNPFLMSGGGKVLTPIIVLMVLTSVNVGIMIGLFLSITLGVTSTQIFVFSALEMAVVLFVYREARHKKISLSC
jgi:hypothetical protein